MYSQSSKETEFNIKLFSQWFHICQGVVRDLNYCRSLTTPLVCIYLTEVYCTSTVNILTSPKFTEKRKSEAYCSSTLSIKLSMTLLELLNRLDVLFYIFWDIFFFCFKQVFDAMRPFRGAASCCRYYWSCSALCRHEETILKCIFCKALAKKKNQITNVLYVQNC